MSPRPPTLGIRAILRSDDPSRPGSLPLIELHDTVSGAIEAGARQIRTMHDGGRRASVDVGESDLVRGVLSAASATRSAALLDAASSGQLLVSGAAASMAADLPAGLNVDDLGSHRFHGVANPTRVFEVRGAGLTSATIRSIDTVAPSIPVPRTPLVGRRELLAEVISSVRCERVVTLTGSGGSGKTRLAVEAALACAGRFDAIQWAELAPLGSDASLVDELAALVGVQHRSSDGRRAALLEALDRGSPLLVLDNAEHLIDAVATLVAEAADRCPALHVLITSREPLGLAAEVVRRVPPLAVADVDEPAAILASDAAAFLIDRLERAGAEVPLGDAATAQLHRICVRLDGIPLALELAAARAAAVPLADLAAGLDDRFRLLSATRRDAQPHQRTLEASIRWSHDLLSEDERVALRRLAVFSGSFEAADAIEVDGRPSGQSTAALDRLIERSLVVVGQDGRLRLLETVRAFAEDRLEESGETRSVRDRHLAWVLTRAAEVAPGFDGPDPTLSATRTRRLMNDVRAAITHAEQNGRPDAIWRILEHVVWSCFYDGHIDEGLDWASRAGAMDAGPGLQASAPGMVAAALLATSRGDHEEIVETVERARAAAEVADDRRSSGRALLLGAAHATWNDPAAALPALIEGRDLCATGGDLLWSAWGECGIALAFTFLGRPSEALTHLDDADSAAATLRSRRLALDAAARRCICEYQLGRWGDAHRTIERGRRLAEGFTTISVTACFDTVDAWLAIEEGHPEVAAAEMDRSIKKYLGAGELQFVPLFVDARARAAASAGRPAEAAETLRTLRAHPGVDMTSVYRHWLDHTLAAALLHSDDLDGARTVADRLVIDATEIGNHLDAARGNLLLAQLDTHLGEHHRAEARIADALETLWRLRAAPATLDALELAGRGDEAGGRADRGRAIIDGVQEGRAVLLAGSTPDLAGLVEVVRRGRGDRRRPAFGWDSLTPTERLVAELVADGLTNPQIAERLFVGRATVKTHVSSVLRKLDLPGRTHLATAFRLRARGQHGA